MRCGRTLRLPPDSPAAANPFGQLIGAAPALPGAVHDTKAARTHGVGLPFRTAKTFSVPSSVTPRRPIKVMNVPVQPCS